MPWIYAARLKTLVAASIPVISSLLILPNTISIKIDIFFLTLIAALLIQIATNYINDLYDYIKGADKNRSGSMRVMQSGLLTQQQMKRGIRLIIFLGIICGIPLVIEGGIIIIAIGLSSFLFGYLYTAGPFPLAYNGLGDLFVFIYFGIIAVMGSYYLQTGFIDTNALYMGISIGMKNIILLTINNIRDYHNDKKINKNTLIVILGQRFGKIYIVGLLIMSYSMIYLLAVNIYNLNIFYSTLFSLPLSINIIYDVCNKTDSLLNQTLAKVSGLLILDCILITIGIYI